MAFYAAVGRLAHRGILIIGLLSNMLWMGGLGGPFSFVSDGLASDNLAQEKSKYLEDALDTLEDTVVFGYSELFIICGDKKYHFNVDVADNAKARAKGLMFRREMPKDNGMLFLFESKRNVIMWMKNTYIPLDIVFIDNKGVIVHIAKSTIPETLDYIYSKAPVISVLELNAGVTADLNINIGDKIIHPYFPHE